MTLAVPLESTLNDVYRMGYAVPLPDEPPAGLERGASGLRLFCVGPASFVDEALWQSTELLGLNFKGEETAQESCP